MIRIFAQLACLGRTIQASFAGVWDIAARRVLGPFANLPRNQRFRHRLRPANRGAHAGDKPGAARFKSAKSDVRDDAHKIFPRVRLAAPTLQATAGIDHDAPYPGRQSYRASKRQVNN
jgi:hypothetical protein